MNSAVHKIHRFLVISSIFLTLCNAQGKTALDDLLGNFLRRFSIQAGKVVRERTNSAAHRAVLEKQQKAAKQLTLADQFPCNLENIKLRSDAVPQSVHEIRPGDIDVIGAMGDSLSAGTGISATALLQEILTQRGRAWSGGGEKTWRSFLTLPNILKEFNPKLFGFALRAAQSTEWESQFNVAENGAISKDMPYMVKELVKRIKRDKRVDLKKHWKMVTLMVGDNDFCSEVCLLPNPYESLKKHKEDLLVVLRYLRDNLPRTIVNIVPPPRLDFFDDLKNVPLQCYFVHNAVCPCIRGLFYRKMRPVLSDVMVKWQQVEVEVGNLAEFDLEDFTIITHMFTLNYTIPKTRRGEIDKRFLAPDCFHLSEIAQGRVANDIWNSLLEPFGNKSTDGAPTFSKFHCPSEEHPYIYTRRNSR